MRKKVHNNDNVARYTSPSLSNLFKFLYQDFKTDLKHFLAYCKAHKTPTQSQPCKELKMPTHNPPTPADKYLSSLAIHISNISLLNTKAHPPPHGHLIDLKATIPTINH